MIQLMTEQTFIDDYSKAEQVRVTDMRLAMRQKQVKRSYGGKVTIDEADTRSRMTGANVSLAVNDGQKGSQRTAPIRIAERQDNGNLLLGESYVPDGYVNVEDEYAKNYGIKPAAPVMVSGAEDIIFDSEGNQVMAPRGGTGVSPAPAGGMSADPAVLALQLQLLELQMKFNASNAAPVKTRKAPVKAAKPAPKAVQTKPSPRVVKPVREAPVAPAPGRRVAPLTMDDILNDN